jgi:hypothetical protein
MATEALLSSRPLSDSAHDRQLLIGRKDALTQVVKAVAFGLNVLVLAHRGYGKTSFLHTCDWKLRQEHHRTIWINGAFMEDASDLVDTVAFQLNEARERRIGSPAEQAIGMMTGSRVAMGQPAQVLGAIRHLASRLGQKKEETPVKRPVIIVDDLRADVAHDLFGRARDEVWSLPLIWLVAGDKARSADYLKAPADSFFGRVVELGPLSPPEASEVLRSRTQGELPEDVAAKIVGQAEGNIRRLITLATDALVEGGRSAAGALERDSKTAERLRKLGPSAQRLWEAVLPLSQVTANDPVLLDRLGWTRVRASQVLNQLEAAGLVESSTTKAGQGRPRKVYRLPSQVMTK